MGNNIFLSIKVEWKARNNEIKVEYREKPEIMVLIIFFIILGIVIVIPVIVQWNHLLNEFDMPDYKN